MMVIHICAVALTTCCSEAVVESHGGTLDRVMNIRASLLPENASREAVVAINGPGISTSQCSNLLDKALSRYMEGKTKQLGAGGWFKRKSEKGQLKVWEHGSQVMDRIFLGIRILKRLLCRNAHIFSLFLL